MSIGYLLDIAIILLTTKVFGMLTRRFNLPQVVGALIAGLVFGPAMLNILHETDFLSQLSELGVIVIMFTAGLTTEIKELKNAGKSGFLVALIGVIVPLLLGTGVGYIFNHDSSDSITLYQNIFIGVILTATSVSITVETLKEIGKFNTKVGNTILAAAIIDDVLGLICLTVITSLGGADVNVGIVLLKIVGFLVFIAIGGWLAYKLFRWYSSKIKNSKLQRFQVLAFVLCLVFAFISEAVFGVADITGAFAAGLVVANTREASFVENRFKPLSYLLLTPIFFANIGINITIPSLNLTLLFVTLAVVLAAVLSKLVGCGIGAKMCGMTNKESIQVGLGMVCRGEVALIVANKGRALGLMNPIFEGPIIIMVVIAAVVTPALLKIAFKGDAKYAGLQESTLTERYEQAEQLDALTMQILDTERTRRDKEK